METTEELTRTYCRLCEAGCGLVATVEDGRLVRVRADDDHPVTQGYACSKGIRSVDIHHDPDRVRRPQRRNGDGTGFDDISWGDAIDEIAARLGTIVDEHGPSAVGIYLGNPNAFNALGSASGMFFSAIIGTDRTFSAVTQDCSNKYAIAELLYGTMSANPIPDVAHTDFLLWIGSNPRVSKSSFFSVGDPLAGLRQARDRGARVVFVDPQQIEPGIGETLQVRPDTDVYLLASMLHEIHRTVGFRLGAFDGQVEKLDQLVDFVSPYSPAVVADVVGLPAATIAQLARDFAAADSASIHASTGLNMGRQGALAYWLVQMLLLTTGNLDRSGGNYLATRGFPMPAADVDRTTDSFEETSFGSFRRTVGMLPGALLPDYVNSVETPLRALIVLAGNPLLTIGGGAGLEAALESLDLLVSIDIYRNATGEISDFVLPATDQFEREDLNTFVQGVQGRPFVQFSPQVVEPEGEQRPEWQIFGELLTAMGHTPLLDPTSTDPLPTLFDGVLEPAGLSITALRDRGGVAELPESGPGGSFERAGIELPLDIAPPALASTFERGHALFGELRGEGPGQVKLITRRTRNTLNTWMQNLPSATPDPEGNPLWINPDHARELGLADGERAVISNEWGSIEAPVKHDPRLRHGVVAMTHGFGNAGTTGMRRAQERPGVNVNILAPHGPGTFDPVSTMAQVTGIAVAVRALAPQAV